MQFPAENSYPSSTFSMFVPALLKPSLINEILDKPDIRLEELLNEEDFVEELKRGNFRLIDFFAKNIQHIKQLLDYIIQVPSNSNDEKRAYQYPLLANEVFEANIDLIMNCFFLSNLKNTDKNYNYISPKKEFLENGRDNNETAAFDEGDNEHRMKINPKNENLLSYLFSFLDTKEELNPVLAGYFSKLLQKLLNRNQRAVIEFAYNNSKILFSMIEHIDQHSLAEIFPLFMCYQSYIFDNNTQEYLEIKLKAIDKIFDLLTDEKQHEKIAHVPDVLDEIMHRNETMADGKEVMAKILSPETFNTILSVFNKKINNSPASHIGNVVLLLIGHFSAKMSQYSSGGVYARYLQKELDEDPIVKMISQHLETLKNFLLVEKQTSISTTFGHNTQTLGIGRLKVVNIIERIIKLGSNRIYAQINSSGIVQILTDMFGQFIWNNMFHATYEKVVYTILDKRDPLLLEALFDKAGFVDYIIKEIKEEECEFPKSRRRVRKGNMGFIIRIANELNRLGGFEKTLEDQLKKNPEWEKLVVPNLKARNELNEKEMGGCHPRNMNFGLMDSLLAYAQSNSDTTGGSETNSTAFDALQPNQRLFISFPNYSDQNEQSNIQIAPQDQKGNEESGKASNSQDLTSYLPGDKLEAPKLGVEEAKHSLTIETSQSATNQPAIQKSYPVLNYSASQKELSSNDNQAKESMVTLNNLAIERELNLKSSETKTALISEYTSQNLSITSNKTVQEKSCDITQDTKNQIDLSKRVFEQLRSSNDILSRLKMEFNMSPTKASTNQEAEENSSISTPSTPNRSESYAPSPVSSPSGEQLLRSSMIETKSGKKVKLKVKKTEKLDGSKILDMINKFKGPSSSTSSIEFSYTDNSQSESGNLLSDPNLAMQEGLPQPAVATSLLMQSNALNQNIGLQKEN